MNYLVLTRKGVPVDIGYLAYGFMEAESPTLFPVDYTRSDIVDLWNEVVNSLPKEKQKNWDLNFSMCQLIKVNLIKAR